MGVVRQDAAITACQHHRQTRVTLADDGGKLNTVHPRHDDIGEHQIEGQLVSGENLKGFFGVPNPFDPVAQVLE